MRVTLASHKMGSNHGLIIFKDTKAKCHKKFTCKGTLLQVLGEFRDWRYEVSHVGIFDPALWTVAPLTFSLVQLSSYLCPSCVWDLGLRHINTCRKAPLVVNFFRWRHFALPSRSLIFLRAWSSFDFMLGVNIFKRDLPFWTYLFPH
jgi:hypothetical protein